MMDERVVKLLEEAQIEVQRLVEDRDSLRDAINSIHHVSDSKVASVLSDALANKVGWREDARRVLGRQAMLECARCGRSYPSGGKRRRYCGQC